MRAGAARPGQEGRLARALRRCRHARRKREQVSVRLIGVRMSAEQAEQRRGRAGASIPHPPKGCQARRVGERQPKAQRQGKQKRKKVSQARLRLADWTILLTNVPAEQLSVDEALVLARYRWQIELYWKLCKQQTQVDTWRSHKAERIETELFAKLLGVLITHWLTTLPWPLWLTSVSIFVVAWIGQFIGHAIEGKRPSFFKDLQFLLIGPLWLLAAAYRKIGLSY